MRHRNIGRQLSRSSSHRKATLKNLTSALFRHEIIRTTLPKAKELRRVAEPMITMAKTDSLARRRLICCELQETISGRSRKSVSPFVETLSRSGRGTCRLTSASSYHPSPELDNAGGSGFKGQKHIIFDDYEGQTIWLSMKIHNLLPEGIDSYWPKFLNLAVGFGARDVISSKPYSVLFLALDLDMTKVIPDNTPFLKLLGEALNFIKVPMPAVRISPHAIWYGLYF